MGSSIEINDTLKLTHAEGLPHNPRVHQVYEFRKSGRRLYHLQPTRVFLVADVAGKWNYIGHAHVLELTIDAEHDQTRGRFCMTKIYDADYARLVNLHDAPPGKGLADER